MRRLQRAWREAERLLEENAIQRAPVNVLKVAEHHARVEFTPLDDSISGALVPLDDGWMIVVNSNHSSVRQRFTVAHELGHLILHKYTAPHADSTFRFRDARSSQGTVTEEIEANQFAAELLMPRRFLLKELKNSAFDYASDDSDEDTLETIAGELASKFDVSRQAMTIRISSLLA